MEEQDTDWIHKLVLAIERDYPFLSTKFLLELASKIRRYAADGPERALESNEEELTELRNVALHLPKTKDGHPYIQHGDPRQFYCCWQNTETGVWSKATCKTVPYDEMIDENHLWSIDGLDLDHIVPCRVFLDEWNRDSTFEALEEERKTKELFR